MEDRNLFIAVGIGVIYFRLLGWLINPNWILFGIESEVVVMCSFHLHFMAVSQGDIFYVDIYIYYRNLFIDAPPRPQNIAMEAPHKTHADVLLKL